MRANERSSEPMSPQEWQWFLQDKNLISKNVQLKLNKVVSKDIFSLLPNATILRDATVDHDEDDTKSNVRVAQGLQWLHKASFHDLVIVQNALMEAQSQKVLLNKRGKAYQADAALTNKEWNASCSDLVLSEYIHVDTQNISQVIQERRDNIQNPQNQVEMRRILSQHSDSLSNVLANYQATCKRIHQPPSHIDTVHQAISKEEESLDYSVDTVTKLRDELEELLAFYQGRVSNCSHSIPAFMTLVATDDIDMLKANTSGLKQVILELTSLRQNGTSMGSPNDLQLLETLQARVKTARKRIQEHNKQLEEMNNKIQTLQEDLEWCRQRIESVKKKLETEIAALLDDDEESDVVEIKLLNI